MTIRTVMLCDECENVFVPDARRPRGGVSREAHAAGWTSTSINGVYTNVCDAHKKEAA